MTDFAVPKPGSLWTQTVFEPTYDPVDMVRSAFMVKTKSAKIVPFNFFKTQEVYLQSMGLRNIVVKPRQVGMSSANLSLMQALAISVPNLNLMVVTHRDDMTESMRQTLKDHIRWLNEYQSMNIRVGVDNADQLEILDTNSSFFFGSSTAPGVGRSRTIHVLLASELAHWQGPNPGAELAAMTESIPDTGLILIESTPNGADGPFYDIYQDDPSYTKHFYPWFLEPSRSINIGGELTLTPEELRLVTMHNLSHDQIAWRRWKWAQLRASGMYFPQEYPEDDISCFTAGLRSVFSMEVMLPWFTQAASASHYDRPVPGDPSDPGGVLRVWEDPRPGMHYIATGDVGGGHVDGDHSVLIVRCRETKRHVATLDGHWNPERFGRESVEIANFYNGAYLSHESTGLGISTVNVCVNTLKYRNYHWEVRGDNKNKVGVPNPSELRPGFNVSPASRVQVTSRIVEESANGYFHSQDRDVLRQMTTARYEKKRFAGGWSDVITFPQTAHDDHYMAFGQNLLLSDQAVFLNAGQQRAQPQRAS